MSLLGHNRSLKVFFKACASVCRFGSARVSSFTTAPRLVVVGGSWCRRAVVTHRMAKLIYLYCLLALSLTPSSEARTVTEALRARRLLNSVHAFFYLWYGNPSTDGKWWHWDHFILPHWTEAVNSRYKGIIQKYRDPKRGDIHSRYYPRRGTYSSRDPETLKGQFEELKAAGVSVVAISWWGQSSSGESADSQGVSTDELVPAVLAAAESVGDIFVAFHLEPYPGRTAISVRSDIQYIITRYGGSSALVPIWYVYDSYHISPEDWATVLLADSPTSLRGTEFDGVFIGLWLEQQDGENLKKGGFDGAYSYFASTGFSFGSTPAHWPSMVDFARANALLISLSVGPGYDDERIRPWNAGNTRGREGTEYFVRMSEQALQAVPDIVSVTSWNEWGEGTQIEPAAAGRVCNVSWEGNTTHLPLSPYKYPTYHDNDPFVYLKKLRELSNLLALSKAEPREEKGSKFLLNEEL